MAIRLTEFMSDVRAAPDDVVIQQLCRRQKKHLRNNHSESTYRRYLSTCRQALKDYAPDSGGLSILRPTKKEALDYRKIKEERITEKQDRQIRFYPDRFISTAEHLITGHLNRCWRKHMVKLALGIAAATGRRVYSEVMTVGRFEVVDAHTMRFSGQCKTREIGNPPYEIPVLVNAQLVHEAWVDLCRHKKFVEKEILPAELVPVISCPYNLSAHRHYRLHIENEKQWFAPIIKRRERAASKDAGKWVKQLFQGVAETDDLMPKELRSMYGQTCYAMYQHGQGVADDAYLSTIFGHGKNPKRKDLMTCNAYKDFYIHRDDYGFFE